MARPRAVAEECLDRMEDQEQRATIGELFAADAVITFPGVRFEGADAPADYLEWAAPRYEWVAKNRERWRETESTAVSIGTLYGVDGDGERFEDVRYVDVYEIEDGHITRLDVWNDLAVEGIIESEARR